MQDSPAHSQAMGQEDCEKWTAATHLQPAISKSDRLLETVQNSMRTRSLRPTVSATLRPQISASGVLSDSAGWQRCCVVCLAYAVAACVLGAVESAVGIGNQHVGQKGAAALGGRAYADGDGHLFLMPLKRVALHGQAQLFGQLAGALARSVGQQQHKFFAAPACRHVRSAGALL